MPEDNRKVTNSIHKMHPIFVKAPWYMVGIIDFIGPFSPASEDGSKFILTISEDFTKWVEVIPRNSNYSCQSSI